MSDRVNWCFAIAMTWLLLLLLLLPLCCRSVTLFGGAKWGAVATVKFPPESW
jgi:hypothetical protein